MANKITVVTNWDNYPIPKEVASISRGGLTTDKVAIKDGIGTILLYSTSSNTNETNNVPFNDLLIGNIKTNNNKLIIIFFNKNNLKRF